MALDINGGLFKQLDVRETPTVNISENALSPIGSVTAWLKSLTHTPTLPSGWVECNGQTLNDSESVYNGITLPDLNGDNRFLRGNSTSGGIGGADTNNINHTHTWSDTSSSDGAHSHTFTDHTSTPRPTAPTDNDSSNYYVSIDSNGSHTHTVSGTTSDSGSTTLDNKPLYINVVYIIRIK